MLVAREAARIGDRYLEVVGAGRGEGGRGVLGRIVAVDREADRRRRQSGGGPGIGERAFACILIGPQDREAGRGAGHRTRIGGGRCHHRGCMIGHRHRGRAADRTACCRHRVRTAGLLGREGATRGDRAARGRPGKRRLRNQGRTELILARRRECLVGIGVEAHGRGADGNRGQGLIHRHGDRAGGGESARIGDRYLEVIRAGRGEGGRRVLGRIVAVDREADRGRRNSGRRPLIGERAFTGILIGPQDREAGRGAGHRTRIGGGRCHHRGCMIRHSHGGRAANSAGRAVIVSEPLVCWAVKAHLRLSCRRWSTM